jgi:hypothetical protein
LNVAASRTSSNPLAAASSRFVRGPQSSTPLAHCGPRIS